MSWIGERFIVPSFPGRDLVPEPANPAGKFRALFGADGVAPPRNIEILLRRSALSAPKMTSDFTKSTSGFEH
jgi:hypothetical protein